MRSRIRRRERCLRFDPHRLGVAHDDRDSHARRADGQIGKLEDLACLLAELDLLVVLEAVELPVHAQLMIVGVLRPELGTASEPAPDTDWYVATRTLFSPAASCSGASAIVSGIVQQFGFATIPLCSSARSPFTSGTTSGIPASSRKAADLSTQSAPAPAARGTSSRLTCGADREEADVEVAGRSAPRPSPPPPRSPRATRRRNATTRTCGCWCIRDRPGTGA